MLALLLLVLPGGREPAHASELEIGESLCTAVTPRERPDGDAFALRYDCAGTPAGYERATLWLRHAVAPQDAAARIVFLIHKTRVDRITVLFRYADGRIVRRGVSDGAFADHWRIGGQLAFRPPERDAALTEAVIRLDRLSDHDLLRIRILGEGPALREATAMTALVSGALTLLLIGLLYNLGLAVAGRRVDLAWHAGWSASVLLWGLLWSQLALFALPMIAGTVAAKLSTLFATSAVMLAAFSAAASLRPMLPRALHLAILAAGLSSGVIGAVAAVVTGRALQAIAGPLTLATLATLGIVAVGLMVAARRGRSEARDLALAWMVPMTVLALTMVVDLGAALGGGGAQVAVLFASAFQAMWVALATTVRFGGLRRERDAARAAELMLEEVARRDPLTGLLNRRGLRERFDMLASDAGPEGVAIILIDVDHFKSINDRWGHDVGDLILYRIARQLRRRETPERAVGRLGGEEFLVVAGALTEAEAGMLAETLRADIAAMDHEEELGAHAVTASIGVARGAAGASFASLYKRADRALYAAKRQGRNCVTHASETREPFEEVDGILDWRG